MTTPTPPPASVPASASDSEAKCGACGGSKQLPEPSTGVSGCKCGQLACPECGEDPAVFAGTIPPPSPRKTRPCPYCATPSAPAEVGATACPRCANGRLLGRCPDCGREQRLDWDDVPTPKAAKGGVRRWDHDQRDGWTEGQYGEWVKAADADAALASRDERIAALEQWHNEAEAECVALRSQVERLEGELARLSQFAEEARVIRTDRDPPEGCSNTWVLAWLVHISTPPNWYQRSAKVVRENPATYPHWRRWPPLLTSTDVDKEGI